MPRGYKIFIIVVCTIVGVGLLPGVKVVWAEVGPDLFQESFPDPPARPPAQGEWPPERPSSATDDTVVQIGEAIQQGDLSALNDGSGVEVVPAAAFVNTGQLGTGSEANDWLFDFGLGFLTSDSATNEVCLAAPVYLAPGSTINSFSVYGYDNFSASNLVVYLDRTNVFDPLNPWDELARVQAVNSNAIQKLTDSAICSDPAVCAEGANVVAPLYNYHVDFCLPAGSGGFMGILGAQVNYTPSVQTPPNLIVHLPLVVKPGPLPSPPPTTLFIQNNTGGVINYFRVQSKEDNSIVTQCNNIPTGNTQCGSPFAAGDYKWEANAPSCNPSTGGQQSKVYDAGPFTQTLFCGSRRLSTN